MHIIFVLPDLPLSGSATRTVHVAEQLSLSGHQVIIVLCSRNVDEELRRRLSLAGVEVARLPSLASVRLIRAFLKGTRGPVVHAALPTAGLLGLFLSRLLGSPLAYSYTNCLHAHRPFRANSAREHVKAALEKAVARRSDILHAVSASVGAQLLKAYPHARSRVCAVPYPVSPPLSDGSDSAVLQLEKIVEVWPRLLCVGRLVPHKRFQDAIMAVASLRAKWPRIMLLILGIGPERDRLIDLIIRLGLNENVRLMGSSGNPGAFLDWADVLVHPSLFEGYPRVFAEARRASLPVVSVDTPYAREFEQAGGRIVLARPIDSRSIAAAIAAVCKSCGPGESQQEIEASAGTEVYDYMKSIIMLDAVG